MRGQWCLRGCWHGLHCPLSFCSCRFYPSSQGRSIGEEVDPVISSIALRDETPFLPRTISRSKEQLFPYLSSLPWQLLRGEERVAPVSTAQIISRLLTFCCWIEPALQVCGPSMGECPELDWVRLDKLVRSGTCLWSCNTLVSQISIPALALSVFGITPVSDV